MLAKGYRLQQVDGFYNLRMMLQIAETNYEALMKMDWHVWKADDDVQFLTSDNPVVSVLPEPGGRAVFGRAFNLEKVEIVFPLSLFACLFARRGVSVSISSVANKWVRMVNKALVTMADRWIFAAEKPQRIASLFDRIEGSGGYGNDFYLYDPDSLRRDGEGEDEDPER